MFRFLPRMLPLPSLPLLPQAKSRGWDRSWYSQGQKRQCRKGCFRELTVLPRSTAPESRYEQTKQAEELQSLQQHTETQNDFGRPEKNAEAGGTDGTHTGPDIGDAGQGRRDGGCEIDRVQGGHGQRQSETVPMKMRA